MKGDAAMVEENGNGNKKLEIKLTWWLVGLCLTVIFLLIGFAAASANSKNSEQDERLAEVERENKTQGENIASMAAKHEEINRRLDSMDKKLDRLLDK